MELEEEQRDGDGGVNVQKGNGEIIRLRRGASISDFADKLEAIRGYTVQPGDTLETVSLRGSSFLGTFTRVAQAGGYDVVENTITGKAYVIARSQIVVNPADELVDTPG